MVHSVGVDYCFDVLQSYDTITFGEEFCVQVAVVEGASCDSTPDELSFGSQLVTATERCVSIIRCVPRSSPWEILLGS